MENKEFEYPRWFKGKYSGVVVRFDSLNAGAVIELGVPDEYEIGYYCKAWTAHTNTDNWIDVTDQYREKTEIPQLSLCKTPHPLKNPDSKHYELWGGLESVEVLEAVMTREELIGWCKGNILKYQLRLGKKDDVQKEMKKIETYQDYLKYLQGLKDED